MRAAFQIAGVCLMILAAGVTTRAGTVVNDGSLASAPVIHAGNIFTITPASGKQAGTNLFYSLSLLNLDAGDTANFTGPAGIRNVLTRVTGGRNTIDGTLQCSISGANFILINSSGVLFGPDASLDVSGSFAVTTANSIKLSDGKIFSSSAAASDATLTTASPAAFGFLGSPSAVSVSGNLSVPAGNCLSVVAGNVTINAGQLQAPGGRITLASTGTAPSQTFANLDPSNPASALKTDSFPALGAVSIVHGAIVSADGVNAPGGRIELQADSLTVNQSQISAQTTGSGQGAGIDLNLRGDLSSTDSFILADTNSSGAAGDISVQAASLTVRDGATISACAHSTGDAGRVNVAVSGSVLLATVGDNIAQVLANEGLSTGIGADSFLRAAGSGNAGNVTLSAASLTITGGAAIDAGTGGTGKGGNIQVNVSGAISIDGTATSHEGILSGIESETDLKDPGGGPGGDLTISAASLNIRQGTIEAGSFGTGRGGSVNLNISGQTLIDSLGYLQTGVFIGGVYVSSDDVDVLGNPLPGAGAGGDITFHGGSLLIQNLGVIDASTLTAANAGDVTVSVGQLQILRGGGISSFTMGGGNGGNVNVSVTGNSLIDGINAPAAMFGDTADTLTGIGALSILSSTGSAGDVNFAADSLTMHNGLIEAASSGLNSGPAGKVSVQVNRNLLMTDSGVIGSQSGLGSAGDVTLTVGGSASLQSGSSITVASLGSDGGDLNMTVRGNVTVDSSSILGLATNGNGGNISLISPQFVIVRDSQLTAAAGNGGNLTVDPALIVLQNSQLSADASVGNGGNIKITADQFLNSNSPITASGGPFGVAGNISLSSPDNDIAGALTPLQSNLTARGAGLEPACGQMVGIDTSSFLQTGMGGLPPEPGGWFVSFEPADDHNGPPQDQTRK